jgi:hypothetical protein
MQSGKIEEKILRDAGFPERQHQIHLRSRHDGTSLFHWNRVRPMTPGVGSTDLWAIASVLMSEQKVLAHPDFCLALRQDLHYHMGYSAGIFESRLHAHSR